MKSDTASDNCEKIVFLLHHVIFSYEQAHEKLVGTTSRAILQELLKGLTETFKLGDVDYISHSKSLEENLQAYLNNLNSANYFDGVDVKYQKDSYTFKIDGCKFSKKRSHSLLINRHICPFAVMAAAVIYYSAGEKLKINETEIDENNSMTVIEKIIEK